ncbi:unnamed protein product [uncultured bacterium]|nr:unnamed protein product [uncultured bacterium]
MKSFHASAADAANDHGLAAQIGMILLLDGRIESVHVYMNDGGVVVHGSGPRHVSGRERFLYQNFLFTLAALMNLSH